MDTRIWSRASILLAAIAMVLAMAWAPVGAIAPPPDDDVVQYVLPRGSRPYAITAGPDGNIWFTDGGRSPGIGRITPSGAVTKYPLPSSGFGFLGFQMWGIAGGPDGNIWFTATFGGNAIGRITPTGQFAGFPTGIGAPTGIAAGPDGNMWFTNSGSIGKISLTGAIITYPLPGGSGGYNFQGEGIAAGPDGNMWFTETSRSAIGRITPAGVITEFAVPGSPYPGRPYQIAAGPDGNMWFTLGNGIGRITPTGDITEYPLPESLSAGGITAGPDGNMWFTGGTTKLGRITMSGTVTEYQVPTFSRPYAITAGPDGNLWFTEYNVGKIGRISPDASPTWVRKPCPAKVTVATPEPTKTGDRILIERITTNKATCFVPKPIVLCRPRGSTAAGEQAFCTTKVTKRGQVQVTTGGYEAVRVTVLVRARPKLPDVTLWRSTTWRRTWLLR